jgi:uncharacterized protein YqcC (DUF446 family)
MNGSQADMASQRCLARAELAALLTELATALQAAGQWQMLPPPAAALASTLPFCCDTLRFTEWLQWLFIPRTRAVLDAGESLPSVSGIAPMAEEALDGCDWGTARIVSLLARFDRLIAAASD